MFRLISTLLPHDPGGVKLPSRGAARRAPEPDKGLHQNIGRACAALEALAQASERGLRFADIERATGLSKATTHRLLVGLLDKRLADFDEEEGRYYLGMRLFAWGAAAGDRFAISRTIGAALDRLAKATEDTVYLMMRDGVDAICLERREGSFPIRTLTLEVGDRRPLGIGAGSMAILAFMPPDDMERTLEIGAAERARYGLADRELRKMMANARQRHHTWFDGQIIPNMAAVGVPLFDQRGAPIASLSVAALSERLAGKRRDEVARLLQQEAAAFTQRLKGASS
jgi:DNA-binding IclR family transcriptional regulator